MRFLPSLACIAWLLLAPTCANAQDQRNLTIVGRWELKNLDPAVNGYAFTRLEVAETFVDADLAGKPTPSLATGWEESADGRVWRFAVRADVKFHDGTALTADHVVHALGVARTKPGSLGKAPIRAIEADGNVVVIRLDEPFSPLLSFLADSAALILAPASYGDKGDVLSIIGTGPYRLAEFKPPQHMMVERFDGYWGKPATIAKATYLATHRSETRTVMAESGDAQIVLNLDPASVQRLARNPKLSVQAVPIPRVIAVKVNAGHPALAEPGMREALSLAVDRRGIAIGILRQPETAATQLFPPSLGGWYDPRLKPLSQDVEKAKALLSGLGWQPGKDGIREKDGRRLRLTLRTYPDRPELPPVATALADQWRTVGVDVAIAIGHFSEILSGHQDGTLEMALIARSLAVAPDPLGTLMQDFGPKGGDWGAMNWSSTRLDAAIATILRGGAADDAAAAKRTVAQILQQELPVIPVVWYTQTAAVSKRIGGFEIDPFERSYLVSRMRWAE
ncbi:MAG: ABC transporter substrate-binding protein [Ferrovibrionaceae bacterium]